MAHMLSYQHGYHAGNFADVIKHLVLTQIIQYLCHKDKPLLYLETHSGRGFYDLKDSQATKTAEFQQGISLVWEQRDNLPDPFTPYLKILKSLNPQGQLRYYPGSPYLAISLLRSQDRLAFSEWHPREFEQLARLSKQGKKVVYRHEDGLGQLKASLPPKERRGLIFIDPSYEIKEEYKSIPQALQAAFTRFATGVYCLWYPIIDNRLRDQLLRGLQTIKTDHTLRIEFYLTAAAKPGMTGCGLFVINPPHTLAADMKVILTSLRTMFNPGVSSYLIEESPRKGV
jgi:23S rRNA (adenine2030-N6)-methyltransferase